jgi:hypothetical protein
MYNVQIKYPTNENFNMLDCCNISTHENYCCWNAQENCSLYVSIRTDAEK